METKDKTIKNIERKIIDELGEEIRELRRQGKLYKFETMLWRSLSTYKKTARNAGNQQE